MALDHLLQEQYGQKTEGADCRGRGGSVSIERARSPEPVLAEKYSDPITAVGGGGQ